MSSFSDSGCVGAVGAELEAELVVRLLVTETKLSQFYQFVSSDLTVFEIVYQETMPLWIPESQSLQDGDYIFFL